MEPSGGRWRFQNHPSHKERLVGRGSPENAAPTLTSFLAGAPQRDPRVAPEWQHSSAKQNKWTRVQAGTGHQVAPQPLLQLSGPWEP